MKYKTELADKTKRGHSNNLTKGAFGKNNIKSKIKCFICGNEHKFTTKKFPVAVKERIKNKSGEIIKIVTKGFLCRKCSIKEAKYMNLNKQHIKIPAESS